MPKSPEPGAYIAMPMVHAIFAKTRIGTGKVLPLAKLQWRFAALCRRQQIYRVD
jgi:hypothetical protein